LPSHPSYVKRFPLAFQTCTYRALIRLSTSVTSSFSLALPPYYSAALSALCYTVFIHRCVAFQYYSLCRPLFLSCLLIVPSHRPLTYSCSLSLSL
jgi:hypothetical protein